MSEPSPTPSDPSDAPLFTFVAAAYNVDRYLDDFIASIEQQTFPLNRVQVIVVDDGSTDNTLATLEAWAARRPSLVTVLSKENGGQASARNVGMEHATGEWVSFIDPDDAIDPGYLSAVARFLDRHGEDTDMVATNRLVLEEARGELLDSHPLSALFDGGDRLYDLEYSPEHFHGAVNAAFFRRGELERQALLFDLNVRPNFEDGHFSCRYLLNTEAPKIGFVSSAKYHYRRRADNSSTVQTALMDPDRFLKAPRYGHLDVLRRASAAQGEPPHWLQNFILYELSYYFAHDAKSGSVASAAHGEIAEQFVKTLGEIAGYLNPTIVEGFGQRPFGSVWRDILTHTFAGEDWRTSYVVVSDHDAEAGEQQIRYRFVGQRPDELITVDGIPYQPVDHKVIAHDFWEHTLMRERVAWVPSTGRVRVTLDGEPTVIRTTYQGRKAISHTRSSRRKGRNGGGGLTYRARAIRKASVQKPVRRLFENAWVLVDRVHAADDNAERLFRYLRAEHPEINAWFTVEKDTADWNRLHADGYGDRVVAWGSVKWNLLLLNCRHLISSQADKPIVAPTAVTRFRKPEWRFSFIEHGVIKDDISRWLNTKEMDLFVTSTPAEHESIAGDDSPYKFTSREVKMTGMPRFDRLLELGQRFPPGRRDLVLVCPTWRNWLSAPTPGAGQRHEVAADFFDSNWVRNWMAFFHHDRLRTLTEQYQVEIGFLPHANMQAALSEFDLPPHVKPISFAGTDVQELMARSVVFVTDYSSMAFNAAYLERPVIYFQFDAAEVMGGGHTGRHSYFDYLDDGFGPVSDTANDTVEALDKLLSNGGDPGTEYMDRIRATYPERDGKCCERTFQAILDIDRRGRS